MHGLTYLLQYVEQHQKRMCAVYLCECPGPLLLVLVLVQTEDVPRPLVLTGVPSKRNKFNKFSE